MSGKIMILTHRGLEPDNPGFYSESSFEAFKSHLDRGFGIEFDPLFLKDKVIVSHRYKEISDARDIVLERGRVASLAEILDLIAKSNVRISSIHLKGINQTKEKIDFTIKEIEKRNIFDKIIIFDLKPEWARYIKNKASHIKLAPSVAHPFDIKRYNRFVGGTLITIEQALDNKEFYDWVWLDEWDTLDENNKRKKLYTKGNFDLLRKAGYKIALVTPELHGTSPGLLGGEAHSDSSSKDLLFKRIKEIISLKPDAVCTDYPEEVRRLDSGNS